jgi:hypothetical protein
MSCHHRPLPAHGELRHSRRVGVNNQYCFDKSDSLKCIRSNARIRNRPTVTAPHDLLPMRTCLALWQYGRRIRDKSKAPTFLWRSNQ